MKIAFTGGGTGGHFFPIIAVAESIREISDHEKIIGLKLYYLADSSYDKEALFANGIEFVYVSAGKKRLYSSIKNFFDVFKTGFGFLKALFTLFRLYPDVVFSKGGYSSFPVVLAARILRIPVVIHESDCYPGRVNKWTGGFAKRVAVSYDEAGQYFPKEKVAQTGQPIRRDILERKTEGAFEYFKLDHSVPTILVLGGSQGAEVINDAILDVLMTLIKDFQIIHQTGKNLFQDVKNRADFFLHDSEFKDRYIPLAFLDPLAQKMAAGAASIVVSRAGSTIFEIASWGLPSIIIPIEESNGDHQKKNAFNYARHGAATVIEEDNLSSGVLVSEIRRCITDKERWDKMALAAKNFSQPDASKKIARVLLDIVVSHE
jgi:UDP-N-acetylglucosamine--N-acetylmuramyl-(pentapeptide) pyrophosphoryl-undecaprenol N-acetylglucosamine transferase